MIAHLRGRDYMCPGNHTFRVPCSVMCKFARVCGSLQKKNVALRNKPPILKCCMDDNHEAETY